MRNRTNVTDLEMVRAAIELEKSAYEFYSRMAEAAKSRNHRELFYMHL